jgi:hypothetical protein
MADPLVLSALQGDTFTCTITVASAITGWTPVATVRSARAWDTQGDPALVLAEGSGLTVTDAAAGTVALALTAVQTAALEPGSYVFGLRLTAGSEVRSVEWDADGTVTGALIVRRPVGWTA